MYSNKVIRSSDIANNCVDLRVVKENATKIKRIIDKEIVWDLVLRIVTSTLFNVGLYTSLFIIIFFAGMNEHPNTELMTRVTTSLVQALLAFVLCYLFTNFIQEFLFEVHRIFTMEDDNEEY